MRKVTTISNVKGKFVKDCFDCKAILPLSHFGVNGKHSNGIQKYKPRCHKCESLYCRAIFYRKVFEIIEGEDKYKCCRCGYNKYYGALEFHHLDPSGKDKNIALMTNYSILRLKQEIDKCILVCANCHREVHGLNHK